MSCEERSIETVHTHICGDCAMEFSNRDFRSEGFDAWMTELGDPSNGPVMKTRLIRTSDITTRMPGCNYCWSVLGHNVPGTYAIEQMIDGDG